MKENMFRITSIIISIIGIIFGVMWLFGILTNNQVIDDAGWRGVLITLAADIMITNIHIDKRLTK